MKLTIAAIGSRMPQWVQEGFAEFGKRFPPHLDLQLVEISLPQREASKPTAERKRIEAQRLQQTADGCHTIALDGGGKAWSTRSLSRHLADWQELGQDVALCIGGPDGLDRNFLGQCHQRWSLGPLTLPHPLVRVIVVEQLYRAHTILANHPYHRG